MGYCHYWGRPAELSLSGFGTFAQECVRRRRALGVPWLGLLGGEKIGNAFGQGRPMFREDVISCNGRPGHEPLIIHRLFHKPQQESDRFNLYWDFVKTNQTPYDDLVVAALVSFEMHFAGAALSSEGARGTGRAVLPSTSAPLVGRRPGSMSWACHRRPRCPKPHSAGRQLRIPYG